MMSAVVVFFTVNTLKFDAFNAHAIKVQDWAMIGLGTFDSDESFTITMSDGDRITIWVTDARRLKLTKEWYDPEGHLMDPATLPGTYTAGFSLEACEYDPTDLVRLHFVDETGNEDAGKTVIAPTGKLQVTLYNTPENAGISCFTTGTCPDRAMAAPLTDTANKNTFEFCPDVFRADERDGCTKAVTADIFRADGTTRFKEGVEVTFDPATGFTFHDLPKYGTVTGGPGTAVFCGTGLSLMLFAALGDVLTGRKRRWGGGI